MVADEDRTPTDPSCRPPPGGDPHVGVAPEVGPLPPGPTADHLERLADFIHAYSHEVRRSRDELRLKDAQWSVEARRSLQGRLRRIGFLLDQECGRRLP